jgi:hypothetical protein
MFNSLLSTAPTIDESVFTVVVNGAKAVLGLFTEFPINVFLAVSLMGVAIGIITRLRDPNKKQLAGKARAKISLSLF